MIVRSIRRGLVLCCVALLACAPVAARAANALRLDGHLVWVMPFQNNSGQPGLDWIGASFPDIMNQRLSSAGFLTIRREDRRYAMHHLGLPVDFHPTQATTYHIAQTLDADYVVFGNYSVTNGQITATARVLTMNGPSMAAPLEEQGKLDQLIDIEDELAWKVAMQIEPDLNLDEQTFLAAGRGLRLDAFENFIRGLIETDPQERIGHLSKAVALSPNYAQAWFALGKAYFLNQQYEKAEAAFSRIPKGSRQWLEANFYEGLSHLYTGNYARAQAEFAAIAAVLPMPEVLNNEGIAINRRGQNGTAFFERVVRLDPQNADYWFNLAVSQRRTKSYDDALKAVDRCLAIRPHDEEAQQLQQNLVMLKSAPAAVQTVSAASATKASNTAAPVATADNSAAGADDSGDATDASDSSDADDSPATVAQDATTAGGASSQDYEPLERIARSYDESSFRQAAFEMEQINALKLRALPAAEQARLLCRQGTGYVNDGLLLEAERQFQLALGADPSSAEAHAGLAQVHEYAGNATVARQEAGKSLAEKPNAAAYLVLARIALAERAYPEARKNVELALQLEPRNSAAQGVLQAIDAQQSQHP